MDKILYRSYPAEVRMVDIDKGIFEGYASVFDSLNSYDEMIHAGAFKKTLQENRDRVKVLYLHSQPFGMPLEIYEDSKGLYTKTQATPTKENEDRLLYIKHGVVDSLSIGFSMIPGKYEVDDEGIRHINELKLYEYSPVIWGADPEARIENSEQFASLSRALNDGFDAILNKDERKTLAAMEPLANTLEDGKPEDMDDEAEAKFVSLCSRIDGIANDIVLKRNLEKFARSLKQ